MTRPLALMFLARSKLAPLDIELQGTTKSSALDDNDIAAIEQHSQSCGRYFNDLPSFLSPLFPHINRWRSFEVGIGRLEGLQLLSAPAPQLEKFSVTVYEHRVDFEEDTVTPSHEVFSGQTPRIRDLSLEMFYPPLSSSIWTGLTRLSVWRTNFPPGSVRQFLLNLAACPDLASLSLFQVNFALVDEFVATPRIALQNLRSLEFYSSEDNVAKCLFASIRFPPFLRLSMHNWRHASIEELFPENADIDSILPSLRSLRNIRITSSGFTDFHELKCYGADDASDKLLFIRDYNDPLPLIVEAFSLRHIESLYIKCETDSFPTTKHFSHLLRDLPGLTSITLDSCPSQFAAALIIKTDSKPCPSLRIISILKSRITMMKLWALLESRTEQLDPASEDITRLRTIKLAQLENMPFEEWAGGHARLIANLGLEVIWGPDE